MERRNRSRSRARNTSVPGIGGSGARGLLRGHGPGPRRRDGPGPGSSHHFRYADPRQPRDWQNLGNHQYLLISTAHMEHFNAMSPYSIGVMIFSAMHHLSRDRPWCVCPTYQHGPFGPYEIRTPGERPRVTRGAHLTFQLYQIQEITVAPQPVPLLWVLNTELGA